MLAIGSDVVVNLNRLYDSVTQTHINNATVSCVLKTAGGSSLYTFSLAYVANSMGYYQGTIPNATTSTLSEGASYVLHTTATTVGGHKLEDKTDLTAGYV